ncbi:hypothetical protein BCV69DRAFT_280761 [Microstroma glucosiphilum]|uniref:Uncharacterized protein n=1 Tax=Pseudomicrostroma glucosiphilum TaxID=1684307 RepID=A0A316UD71_9BASI|nr:hypothetical protein BCV69DRAFT_280761 [Pseudomicrostroma glucosiphilum]PWN23146.1 hypothetical protein BCV69DRAFT_280761 [Pseudomicrostroma glucosiphilum]
MPPRRAAAAQAKRRFAEAETDSDPSEGAESDSGESSASHSAYTEEGEDAEEEDEELGASSEGADEDEEDTPPAAKRKRGAAVGGRKSAGGRSTSSQTATPVKRMKAAPGLVGSNGKGRSGALKRKQDSDEEEEEDGSSVDGDGVLQVTKLAPAPSQKHQAGKVGFPVIDFLAHLANPVYNDREWFHAHEKVWKWVKEDWDSFVSNFLETLMDDVDETVPFLPAKDMVYRIHRDIRFSNDKTPYKRTLMATFSRGGRKGPYAGYHLVVRANGQTGFHAGLWDPPAPLVNQIREHIKNDTQEFRRLKQVLSTKEFVRTFGAPKPDPKKGVQGSLWGSRDQLKSAPKGVDKSHPEIHYLRLKSMCISVNFTDLEVTNDDPKKPGDFKTKCIEAGKVAKDFVEVLNEMMYPSPD